jgi:hypothetical protein
MRFFLRRFRENHDAQRARELRAAYGRLGWLVSWRLLDDGSWLVRLSCPDWPETVEASGPTRRRAIFRADEALRDNLATRSWGQTILHDGEG